MSIPMFVIRRYNRVIHKKESMMISTSWVDRQEYPFQSHALQLPAGQMHYINEGQGETIVMVHGNPTWSFVYRNVIKNLASDYHCVAVDHLGFGLSDKPSNWSYLPRDHAQNLRTAIDQLGLKNITLVVQDWGGPIGLSYAIEQPDNVKRLCILNTWMWSVKNDWYYWGFSSFMGGPIGRYLILNHNFFAGSVMRMATGDKSKLSPHIHRQYLDALPTPETRKGSWVFPREIMKSDEWLSELWAKRDRIASKPAALAWGMRDIAFREKELQTWMNLFPQAEVTHFHDAGHFVQEEKSAEVSQIIWGLMQKYP